MRGRRHGGDDRSGAAADALPGLDETAGTAGNRGTGSAGDGRANNGHADGAHADDGRANNERAAGDRIERELYDAGAVWVAGVDEVGRGSWAGPVVVCAALAAPGCPPPPELPGRGGRPVGLTDSKLLPAAHRAAFAEVLPDWLAGHAMGESSAAEIDEVGMTEALRRAARRALEALPYRPDAVILDGGHDFVRGPWRVRCEVKADRRSVTVAAASVLAKVYRDGLMAALAPEHPEFAFEGNAGYPSPEHQRALAALGPTPHHRLSWSYLDDLPQWRHLRKHRDPLAGSGQLSLL